MKSDLNNALKFFSALADETRLKILLSLIEKPQNVTQIYDIVGKDTMTISAISHQLKTLADNNIVKVKRKGRQKVYGLSEDHCWCILRDVQNKFDGCSCKSCNKNNYHLEELI
ncbi:winged helix-turn-helix transcriptional regulator [archaeon]|jgi:ArsR family transcriptional regulator, lead/cadmium/zinc/bismuth-responsive transcriptional repressor|nr:winged helix-turn-helix transcriptional regulator [archaeon]MBT4352902.1 winged helix-turn-helix transcriptional regulator [archaeon]MBT4648458.1 winged helix-turn-helix transcriptional regulator [archaeon]MBT6821733.1 winged helix-turn-helix transcriptional regulator [archaeon]MBT7391396.1 winged helix-turn-helix transcriptional regulator [archaeon]